MIPRASVVGLLTILVVLSQIGVGFARPIWIMEGPEGEAQVSTIRDGIFANVLDWSDGIDGLLVQPSFPSTAAQPRTRESFLSQIFKTLSSTRDPHPSPPTAKPHDSDATHLIPPTSQARLSPRDISAGLPSWFNALIAVLIVVPALVGVGVASIALCGLCGRRKAGKLPAPAAPPTSEAKEKEKDRNSWSSSGSGSTGSGGGGRNSLYTLPNGPVMLGKEVG